ncbi:ribose ABC transporter substrate-binding protein RbsB [Oceanivirga miroungae]|uniref:LacI family transcriptional regulator n=1 Tax=Oceanivirga miroungae TaxID=1130046 RepID=A0A6I8M6M7_9FUSO|nr:ribose ABC transporter substrate-binding protein RbsB [Oceanivirga miroungae]VWL85034.1 LacI family transcriptional regulator [Oceanivirga miroungae]
MKKLFYAVLMSAFVFSCGSKEATKTVENANKKIGVVISTLNNPFFVTLKEGIEEKAKEYNYDLVVIDSQNDSAKELSSVEDLLVQKVDLILINPTDSDAVTSSIKRINEANVPVITLDRGANGGKVVAHVASDNVKGGQMAGEFILEKLNSKGKVVELEGISGTTAARERGEGFNKAIEGKLEVVARQTANFDRTKGLEVMENILQSNPEINAVFAHNDEMALGALKAIEATKRNILVVGFDAIDDAVASVKEGKLGATVAQQPKLIGILGVETAKKVLDGKQVEKYIPVDLQLVK